MRAWKDNLLDSVSLLAEPEAADVRFRSLSLSRSVMLIDYVLEASVAGTPSFK